MADSTGVQEARERNLFSSTIAIIGFIILIVIAVWGLVHGARLSGSWFTSLFNRSAPAITLTAPKSANSGTPFSISWKYTTSDKGMYAFLYQCKTGLQFQTPGPTGAMNNIPCGAAYSVSSTNSTLSLTPFISGYASTSVPLSLIFIPSATGTRAEGAATIAINSGAAPITPPTITSQQPSLPSEPSTPPVNDTVSAPVRTGPADLLVQITAVGMIDPVTGEFVHRLPVSPNDMAAVQFDISNIGGRTTGTWYFTAQLPTQSGYLYTSLAQAPLAPDGHIENTLRFTQVAPNGGLISISADPNNLAGDYNRSNNYASQWLGMPVYTPAYTPSYTPQYYPGAPMPYGTPYSY